MHAIPVIICGRVPQWPGQDPLGPILHEKQPCCNLCQPCHPVWVFCTMHHGTTSKGLSPKHSVWKMSPPMPLCTSILSIMILRKTWWEWILELPTCKQLYFVSSGILAGTWQGVMRMPSEHDFHPQLWSTLSADPWALALDHLPNGLSPITPFTSSGSSLGRASIGILNAKHLKMSPMQIATSMPLKVKVVSRKIHLY